MLLFHPAGGVNWDMNAWHCQRQCEVSLLSCVPQVSGCTHKRLLPSVCTVCNCIRCPERTIPGAHSPSSLTCGEDLTLLDH